MFEKVDKHLRSGIGFGSLVFEYIFRIAKGFVYMTCHSNASS
jgi:hypothetical protein